MHRALIIDDEPGIRFALRRWFERQGWGVEEAGDGDEALGLLRASSEVPENRYDVIVCDVNLPKRSGEALHALLSTERPELLSRFIFSTGDDVSGAAEGTLLHRHPWVLQKPFEMATLKGLVSSVTGTA